MKNSVTKLRNIEIERFRGLKNVNIEFGERLTLICGKNGTSKSTILGVVAQAFSFRKDYTHPQHADLSGYTTLTGERFESVFSEHFRLSEQYDKPGSMAIRIKVYHGAENAELNLSLGLYGYHDRSKARPIVRGNSKINGASSSRNVTHPVIYLSLKRLMPIALREKYNEHNINYLKDNKASFRALNNRLLSKSQGSHVTATTGTINSVVVHGADYDKDSVSAGEDNVGQILQAIFSFRKLKDEYSDYRGGILLIDEADAGLFPAAQTEFIDILQKEAKDLNLQIIVTSHSPTMIERVYQLSQKDVDNYKTIYLTDTFGDISVKENASWPEIYADLHVDTIRTTDELQLPKVNVYFEDGEGHDFFCSLITEQKSRRPLNLIKDVTLGCENYKQLIKKKIAEFSRKSIVVFDADVTGTESVKNALTLPGGLPPDQLLFLFLYRLPAGHEYWKNEIHFTRPVFLRAASDVVQLLGLPDFPEEDFDLNACVAAIRNQGGSGKGRIREVFKEFYKHQHIQAMVKGRVKYNPFRQWAATNQDAVNSFKQDFLSCLTHTLVHGHGVESAKVEVFLDGSAA